MKYRDSLSFFSTPPPLPPLPLTPANLLLLRLSFFKISIYIHTREGSAPPSRPSNTPIPLSSWRGRKRILHMDSFSRRHFIGYPISINPSGGSGVRGEGRRVKKGVETPIKRKLTPKERDRIIKSRSKEGGKFFFFSFFWEWKKL